MRRLTVIVAAVAAALLSHVCRLRGGRTRAVRGLAREYARAHVDRRQLGARRGPRDLPRRACTGSVRGGTGRRFCASGRDLPDTTRSYSDTTAAASLPDGPYCYFVQADDGVLPANSNMLDMTVDKTPPIVTAVTQTGGDGCTAAFTLTSATVTDNSVVALTANGTPFSPGAPYVVPGNPYDIVPVSVVATDAAGNVSVAPFVVGNQRVLDTSGPGATSLEVTTDPVGQTATLNWAPSVNDGAPVTYNLRTKGPQGVSTAVFGVGPVVRQGLQVDATYEFTLEPVDACGRSGGTSVRLVRLNDTIPPTKPVVATPVFNASTHIVALTWTAATRQHPGRPLRDPPQRRSDRRDRLDGLRRRRSDRARAAQTTPCARSTRTATRSIPRLRRSTCPIGRPRRPPS